MRKTFEDATIKKACKSKRAGRGSDDFVLPNLGSLLSCVDLWFYAATEDYSRTLHHYGMVGDKSQDERIAEDMVNASTLHRVTSEVWDYISMTWALRIPPCCSWPIRIGQAAELPCQSQ